MKKTINHQPLTINHQFGFTLLELLVVIAIIGILIAMGVASYATAQKKGRDAKRKADLKAIQSALEQCYSLDTQYPASIGSTLTCPVSGTQVMDSVPSDPKSGSYYFDLSGAPNSYRICADLEGDGTWTGSGQDFCVTNLQ